MKAEQGILYNITKKHFTVIGKSEKLGKLGNLKKKCP